MLKEPKLVDLISVRDVYVRCVYCQLQEIDVPVCIKVSPFVIHFSLIGVSAYVICP